MKVETKKRCPKCGCELNYNRTNLKKYLTKNGRIRCKNKECGHLLSKEISDDILHQLNKKSVVKRLTS